MRRTPLILVSLLVAILPAACEHPPPPLTGTGMDMFGPVKMRLHPLSRLLIVPATGPASQPGPTIEARIEFTDQFGDVTKAPASLTLDLYALGPLNIKGALLGTWTIDLATPEGNREHYDRVTRTYLIKVPAPDLTAHPRVLLVATATLLNAARLMDDMEFPPK